MTTPEGVYPLTQAFGVAPDPGTDLPYVQVDASHYWVDDPNSQYYNQFVSTNEVEMDWASAERGGLYLCLCLRRRDRLQPRLHPWSRFGILLHCSTGEPTFGCVSVPSEDMLLFCKI